MSQYPNDPGPDQHRHHGHHRPHDEMSLITSDVFQAGIALQTQYSYKCSELFHQKATEHTDGLAKKIADENKAFSEMVGKDFAIVNDGIKQLGEVIGKCQMNVSSLFHNDGVISKEIGNRLSPRERMHLLERVYSMC
jgi:hypothetical protein